MKRTLYLCLAIVLLASIANAQFGRNSPFPSHLIIKDLGSPVTGAGRTLDLGDNITATFDSVNASYLVAITAGSANTIYVEEGDAAKADSSGADLYIDFDGGDFDVGVVGNETNITLAAGAAGDITAVGDVPSGAAFDGTAGTGLTANGMLTITADSVAIDGTAKITFNDPAENISSPVAGTIALETRTGVSLYLDTNDNNGADTKLFQVFLGDVYGGSTTDLFAVDIEGDLHIGDGVAGKDYEIVVDGETTNGKISFMEDEDRWDFDDGVNVKEDFHINLDNTDEEIVITQSNTVGTENVPLIFINDDRTGATSSEIEEAALKIDAEGHTALYVANGTTWFAAPSYAMDNITRYSGNENDWSTLYDTNGTGLGLLSTQIIPSADNVPVWWMQVGMNANNMTTFDAYTNPTIVLATEGGTDANDFGGLAIGGGGSVEAAWYFDFQALTGAADGVVNAATTEYAPTLRFGKAKSACTNAVKGGDACFNEQVEIDRGLWADGGITTDSVQITGLDCTGSANGGALTTDVNGVVSCSDDDTGAGAGDISDVGDVASGAAFNGTGSGLITDQKLTITADSVGISGALTADSVTADSLTSDSVSIADDANIQGLKEKMRFNLPDPNTLYDIDTQVVIWPDVDSAITVTRLYVTCDAAANEIAGDLKQASAFIGLGGAAVIETFDTTSGVREDTNIATPSVAAGQDIYLDFDSQPNAAITQCGFTIEYYYD